MAKFSLSRHDTQARFGAILSLLSCVSLAAMAVLILRHIDRREWIINYGRNRGIMIQATAAITILLAAIGFGMGLSSAGQRRNDRPKLSWIGFFLGAAVICVAAVLLFLFRSRGEMVTY